MNTNSYTIKRETIAIFMLMMPNFKGKRRRRISSRTFPTTLALKRKMILKFNHMPSTGYPSKTRRRDKGL